MSVAELRLAFLWSIAPHLAQTADQHAPTTGGNTGVSDGCAQGLIHSPVAIVVTTIADLGALAWKKVTQASERTSATHGYSVTTCTDATPDNTRCTGTRLAFIDVAITIIVLGIA